jgi:hypothetical protein
MGGSKKLFGIEEHTPFCHTAFDVNLTPNSTYVQNFLFCEQVKKKQPQQLLLGELGEF